MEPSSPFDLQLTSNQLKLIALVSMTIDHIGQLLLPQWPILRIIGRLAFPIFAYMIAEGCRYTAHRGRYLATVFAVGVLWQVAYWFLNHSLRLCILFTFSLSIVLIYVTDWARAKKYRWIACLLAFLGVVLICQGIPGLLPNMDYHIDYGLSGVFLPVLIFLPDHRQDRLIAATIGLSLVALQSSSNLQWYALLALPLLACYQGKRGTRKLKYLFYIYYPAHLALLWTIRLLLER